MVAATFGKRLRQLRGQARLSVAELARRAELTENAIYKIEAKEDAQPQADTIAALARALDVPSDLLLGLAEETGMDVQPVVKWVLLPLVERLQPGQLPVDARRGELPVAEQSIPAEYANAVLCVFVAPDDALAPDVRAGEMVLVVVDEEVRPGQIALLWDAEAHENILRYIQADGVGVCGYSTRAEHPPLHLPADAVIGRAVRTIGRDL